MSKDISLILPSQKDLGAVYISDIRTAQTLPWLKEYRIGAIVTVIRGSKLSHKAEDVPRYLYLPAQDKESFNISQYFEISTSFIGQSRRHTNVLVHCIAGISRSATILAAYLINTYGYSPQSAIALIQKRRKKVSPNKGFRKQLQNINTGFACKRRQETEETTTSPKKIEMSKSMSLQRQNSIETALKIATQKNAEISPMRMSHSSVMKRPQKPIEIQKKKEKIVSKIEKVKANLINKLANSTPFQKLGQDTTTHQPITMATLLQSKIYQNKIRTKY